MKKKFIMKKLRIFLIVAFSFNLLLLGCDKFSNKNLDNQQINANVANNSEEELGTDIRIITTSDLHGKMTTWNYYNNEESLSGSLTQVASVIKEFRNKNTILVDVGDVIQDNCSELFLDEEVHPMILGMNNIGYDVCTIGNHEFNFGMDIVKKVINTHKAKVLLSNVYDSDGKRLADPYTIIERSGVRIAFIGVVTPNISNWDKKNLVGYTVTNPIDEVKNAVLEIGNNADVIILIAHMDENRELETPGSGLRDIVKECPEIDFICAGHGHREIVGKEIFGCTYVENLYMGQTVMVTDIHLNRIDNNWKIEKVVSNSIKTNKYEIDDSLQKIIEPYDIRAKQNLEIIIGKLQGGPLVEENIIEGIPRPLIEDTALMDLINEIIRYYSGADVSAIALTKRDSNIIEGDIKISDVNNIYRFNNALYKLKITGKQLKKWMEWSADFYKKSCPKDLTIAFSENKAYYLLDFFSGINYEINISKPIGERIENLTWPDGRPVKDDEVFTIVTSDYRVNSNLMKEGVVYTIDDEMPEILEINVREDIGNIKDMIIDYIKNVKNGIIIPKKDNNWKITGFEMNIEKQKEINELVKNGKLKIGEKSNDKVTNTIVITEDMLEEAKKEK